MRVISGVKTTRIANRSIYLILFIVRKKKNLDYFHSFIFFFKGVVFMEFDRFWSINEVEMIYFEQYAKLFRKCIAKKIGEKNFMFNTNLNDDVSNFFILKTSEIEKVSKFQCCTK